MNVYRFLATDKDRQSLGLQLTSVKTGNSGLLCDMASNIDIAIVKKYIIKHEYLLHELVKKIKDNRIL